MKVKLFVSTSAVKVPAVEHKLTITGSGAKPESKGTLRIKVGTTGRTLKIEREAAVNNKAPKSKVVIEFLGKGKIIRKGLAAALSEIESVCDIKLPAKVKTAAKKYSVGKLTGTQAKELSGTIVKDPQGVKDAKVAGVINASGLPTKKAKDTQYTQSFLENLYKNSNMRKLTAAQAKAVVSIMSALNGSGKKPTAKQLEVLGKIRAVPKSKAAVALTALKKEARTAAKATKKPATKTTTSGGSKTVGLTAAMIKKASAAILKAKVPTSQRKSALKIISSFSEGTPSTAQLTRLLKVLEQSPTAPANVVSLLKRKVGGSTTLPPRTGDRVLDDSSMRITNVTQGIVTMQVPIGSVLTPAQVKNNLKFAETLNISNDTDYFRKSLKSLVSGRMSIRAAQAMSDRMDDWRADGVKGIPNTLRTAIKKHIERKENAKKRQDKQEYTIIDDTTLRTKTTTANSGGTVNFVGLKVKNPKTSPLTDAEVKKSLKAIAHATRAGNPTRRKNLISRLQQFVRGTLVPDQANVLLTALNKQAGVPRKLTTRLKALVKAAEDKYKKEEANEERWVEGNLS